MQLTLSLVLLAWPKSTKRSRRWIPEAVRCGYTPRGFGARPRLENL